MLVLTIAPCAEGQKGQLEGLYHAALKDEQHDAARAFNSYLKIVTSAGLDDETVQLQSIIRMMRVAKAKTQQDETSRWVGTLGRRMLNTRGDTLMADFFFGAGTFYDLIRVEADSSLESYRKALAIRVKIYGNAHELTAACYHGMGDVYKYRVYDFTNAEKCYEKALAMREKILSKNDRALARNYYSLATTNRSQQDFEKAIAYGLRAIDIVKGLDDAIFLERTYTIVANIYRDMQQYELANSFYAKAIDLNYRSHGNSQNEDQAINFRNQGETLLRQQKYEAAIKSLEEAMRIYQRINNKDQQLYIYLLQRLAEAYFKVDRFGDSYQILGSALKLATRKSGQASQIYKSMGDYFDKTDLPDSALYYFQKALVAGVTNFESMDYNDNPPFAFIDLKENMYDVLLAKGHTLTRYYDKSQEQNFAWSALSCFSLAEKLLTVSRNSLDMEEAKWSFVETNFDLYENSLSVLYSLSQTVKTDSVLALAYRYFETSKSKTLADGLAAAEYANPLVVDDSLLTTRNNLKMTLFNYNDVIKKARNEEERRSIHNSIVDLDRKIESIEREIERKYPEYLGTKYEYHFPSLQKVKEMTGREDALLLHYFWGEEFVYGLGVSGLGVQFQKIGRTDSVGLEIKSLLSHFAMDRNATDPSLFHEFAANSFKLYKHLVEPFTLKTNFKTILIIPDGPICLIPFEVLTTAAVVQSQTNYKQLPYLVLSSIVGYSFSVSALMKSKDVRIDDPAMLAFGYTGGAAFRSPDSSSLEDLWGSKLELESLAKRFPRGRFLSDTNASEANFKALAPSSDLIHLAIHGGGDAEKDFSGSLYFRKVNDLSQDGELHWYELYGIRLKAFLAVLSSCESGIGKSYKGEGMLSMASAFAYSGCQNIVMGLWKVNDQVSVQLMDNFYKSVAEGKNIPEALALAKRNYLANADELTANPNLWGALVAYGNKRMIQEEGQWKFLVWGAIGLALMLALYIRFWYRSAAG